MRFSCCLFLLFFCGTIQTNQQPGALATAKGREINRSREVISKSHLLAGSSNGRAVDLDANVLVCRLRFVDFREEPRWVSGVVFQFDYVRAFNVWKSELLYLLLIIIKSITILRCFTNFVSNHAVL